MKQSRQPSEFFCKTLTASDTSTHGGFSVPRRAAEKIFPSLDYSTQPPAQELCAKDLHDASWTFRHIYRGQPKRHLLTTGWSVFVSAKKLVAGDSVLFVRDENSRLLLGIRRAARQPPSLSSSVLSSDSMQIGIHAAAAHAVANNSPFTIFYNPRATPSEFVVPLAKYQRAVYTQVTVGMRFRMMFETEESGIRRFMGTITGISDLDPERWRNSPWRNLQVGWDESTAGERRNRVSLWEIEPVVAPFYVCPPSLRPRFPTQPGIPDDGGERENGFRVGRGRLGEEGQGMPGMNLMQWMGMQQGQQSLVSPAQVGIFHALVSSATSVHGGDDPFRPQPPPPVPLQPTHQYPQPQFLQAPLATVQPLPQMVMAAHPSIHFQQQQPPQQSPTRPASCPVGLLDQQSSYIMNQGAAVTQAPAMHIQQQMQLNQPQFQLHLLHTLQQQQQQQLLSQLAPNLLPQVPLQGQLPHHSAQMQPPLPSKHQALPPLGQLAVPHGNMIQELRSIKNETDCTKELQNSYCRRGITDRLEASSSATSFCADGGSGGSSAAMVTQEGFSTPPLCVDNNMAAGLAPDALLKAFPSSRELQGLLTAAGYVNSRNDPKREISSREITSQSFGPGCNPSTACAATTANENGSLTRAWMAQQPRMRTYTKVQKRGSVGRCIDVTRYRGYSELRRDLAAMFGIEGQLEDPHRTDWKLVYVDHENDILLVGDDPWEEFVSCVQSIKILSGTEVQQMSLDNLVNGPSDNPACSGSDSQWRAPYDDSSATSFGH
ncbi:auxin response factor 16-like isoform X2 [Wolffia australiana]